MATDNWFIKDADVIEWSAKPKPESDGAYLVMTAHIIVDGSLKGSMADQVFIPFGSLFDPKVLAMACVTLIMSHAIPVDRFQYTLRYLGQSK